MAFIHDEAAYDLGIDHRLPPQAPLPAGDAAWADALPRGRGLREA